MKDFLFIGGVYHKQMLPMGDKTKRYIKQENGTRSTYRKCIIRTPTGEFEFFLEENISLKEVVDKIEKRGT